MGVRQNLIHARGAMLVLLLAAGALMRDVSAASEAQSPRLEPIRHAQVIDRAAQLPLLQSLLVSIDGKVVIQQYFNGASPSRWANLKSASKSVLSTLVGIALDRGYIESVRQPIGKFFPELLGSADDSGKRAITIEDLLTMRSGLESTSRRNYGKWVQSGNWVRHVLTRPMVDVPGGRMIYSTGNSHLLSAVLTQATGMSTLDFARRYLAEPLDIKIGTWPRDPQGIYFGGNEMHLSPRAMVEFGELYLNNGRAGNRQVVSETWVEESFKPRTHSPRHGHQYGYGWWMRTFAGHQTFYAMGYGGQYIFVIPDLRLVVVTTSSPSDRQKRRAHRRAIYDLMEQDLAPAADSDS